MLSHLLVDISYDQETACFLHLHNYSDSWELFDGMEVGDDYPSDVCYKMNPSFPDQIGLADFVHNSNSTLVVSQRVRDFLEAQEIPHMQFLDVKIVDHKGRERPEPYYHLNFIELHDCIDQDKTQFEWNAIDEEKMTQVSNLTLDPQKVAPLRFGRLKFLTTAVVADQAMVKAIESQGFTGIQFINVSEYKR